MTAQTAQAVLEVAPIALVAWITLTLVVCAVLASGGRTQARHARDSRPAPSAPIVVAQPSTRRHVVDYAAAAAPIEMPTPRPYTGGIPVLVVDGPPSTRGSRAAPELPVERRAWCSLCRDGEVILAATGACPWCGLTPAGAPS